MKKIIHIALAGWFISAAPVTLFSQKKENHQELSEKEVLKYNRLFIDASKAKILSDYEQAIKLYEACIKINPKEAAPYYELGSLYMQFGEVEQAIEFSETAANLVSSNFYYRLLYAEILRNAELTDEALAEYEKIMKDFPEKINVYLDLALLYIMKKDYDKAIDTYNQLENVIGPNEDIKLKKQYLYLQTGEVQKSTDEIEMLIEMYPDKSQYYLLLAEIQYINGLNDKALKTYKRAIEKFPDDANVHLSIADYYKSEGSIDKAVEHLKLAYADQNADIDLKVKSILSFFDIAGQNTLYRDDLDDLGQILLKTHPNDPRVLTVNGDINLNLNKPRIARKYFMRAAEIDNSRYPIWSQLILLEADLGIFDTLVIHCQQALELFPNQPVCYYFLGYGKSRLKEYGAAAEAYKNGLDLVVDNGDLRIQFLLGLADSYNEIKEYNNSDLAFQEILKIDSNNTIALNNYSYYLSVRGENLEEALRMSAKSNKLEPNQSTYLDTYAWIFYKLKRYEEAAEWMNKSLQSGGNSSGVILEHMGDIQYQLNNIDEAVNYWEKAKQTGETSEFIERKISERKLYE